MRGHDDCIYIYIIYQSAATSMKRLGFSIRSKPGICLIAKQNVTVGQRFFQHSPMAGHLDEC